MPIDQHDTGEDDDEKKDSGVRKHKDFDCPSCNANNPREDALVDGDEVLCNYCGTEYRVKITEEGKLKFKEL